MDIWNNYECDEQMDIFDYLREPVEITKPIRLIELFSGYGSQALAFKYLGIPVEHHFVCEIDKYACLSYSAIHGINVEPTDIMQVTGADLKITETDKYEYIMTYSFPCTDLSVAGQMKGMAEGSGTRSSLLWEVKRLLEETEELPQILMMENVPQVHSLDNMPHFRVWLDYLESKGYSTYFQDLNAKDFGVAQSRNRTFAFSILGDYNYKFPNKIQLNKVLKNYLEPVIDEKYYVKTDNAWKLIDDLIKQKKITFEKLNEINIMTRLNPKSHQREIVYDSDAISPTLQAAMGTGGNQMPFVLEKTNLTEPHCFNSKDDDGIQPSVQHRVYDTNAISFSITTGFNPTILEAIDTKNIRVLGNTSGLKTQARTVYDQNALSPTLLSGMDKGNTVPYIIEKKIYGHTYFPHGYFESNINFEQIAPTLDANNYKGHRYLVEIENKESIICSMRGRNPDNPTSRKKSDKLVQMLEPNKEPISNAITTVDKDNYVLEMSIPQELSKWIWNIDGIDYLIRIRKLTPRECGRLMGVQDQDIDKILGAVSNSQAYKQFGNSIVTNVMMECFKNLHIKGA